MADNRLIIYGLIATGVLVLLLLFIVLRASKRTPKKRDRLSCFFYSGNSMASTGNSNGLFSVFHLGPCIYGHWVS